MNKWLVHYVYNGELGVFVGKFLVFGVLLSKRQQKMALFQEILIWGGGGAKTNVGYGQLKILPIAKKYVRGDKLAGIVKEFKEEPNGMNSYVEIS